MTNKTAQFTPGPWGLCNWMVGNNTPTGEVTICGPEGDEHICTMDGNEDNQANAQLIAAAPAMYDALREAQELIRSLVAEEMIHSSELQRVGNCQANMWEALAQAEGKQ